MKKRIFLVAALVAVAGLMMMSCGGSKKVASQSSAPFAGGAGHVAPCQQYDDDEYFAATGIYSGSAKQKGVVEQNALVTAQNLVRTKMAHVYQGAVNVYMEGVGNNKGNDVENQLQTAGAQIIQQVVNSTSAVCIKWSDVGDDGHVECYVGIKISKAQVANAVADKLAKSEKKEIRDRAESARKAVADYFAKQRSE